MKKLFLAFAALLCCSLAFAQEAEGEGTTLQFIPRFEVNPYAPLRSSSKMSGLDFSNSSLYTLFEGSIGSLPLSYSIEGHWLSTEPGSLYENTFRSDDVNWLDWAYLTYSFGSFELTAGKQMLAIGTFELDEYDVDSHINLSSTVWNNLPVYQWGAKLAYNFADDSASIAAQIASSPFAEYQLYSRLFSYSLYSTMEAGPWSAIWSANLMQTPEDGFVKTIALGNKITAGDFDFILDVTLRGYESPLEEYSVLGSAVWNPSESLSLGLKGGYETVAPGACDVYGYMDTDMESCFVPTSLEFMRVHAERAYKFAGAFAHWYPTDDLRVHAVAVYNNFSESLSLNVGVTYWFDLAKYLK